jgi:dihydroxy-acid dehydratase
MREMSVFIHQMSGQGLEDSTALITDGRFSGTDHGCFVGHISPEAAEGGTIALVEDGDEITVDIETRRLTLHVSLEELEERRKHWHYEPKIVKGYMSRYLRLAESAGRGAVLT